MAIGWLIFYNEQTSIFFEGSHDHIGILNWYSEREQQYDRFIITEPEMRKRGILYF